MVDVMKANNHKNVYNQIEETEREREKGNRLEENDEEIIETVPN